MLSFWEKQTLVTYDFVIVGAGIMGASVAFELRNKYPLSRIVILERGIFPTGASTKNAGFACFGSPTEILHDIQLNGECKTIDLVQQRIEGIRILKERLGEDKIGYTGYGGYELLLDGILSAGEIDYINELMQDNVFSDVSANISAFGFSPEVRQLLFCSPEGQIDSGQMMMHYLKLLEEKNIRVITGANVVAINEDSIEIRNPTNSFSISAAQIFVCTNAFVKELFPDIDIKPGRGQVLITKPVEGLKWKGSFHFDEGFYYFRNVGNRLLFGGGRNLDMKTEETVLFEENLFITEDLIEKIRTIILPDIEFEIEQTWQGIMGFAENKLPLVVRVDKHTTYVMACNGMGVALSPYIAQQLVVAL